MPAKKRNREILPGPKFLSTVYLPTADARRGMTAARRTHYSNYSRVTGVNLPAERLSFRWNGAWVGLAQAGLARAGRGGEALLRQ